MIEVAAASLADAEDVASMEWDVFGATAWSPRTVDECFASLGSMRVIYTARDAGELAGYAIAAYQTGNDEPADVERVAVAQTQRRKGIGATLLERLLATVRAEGASRALLEVADDNLAARALYADLGFVEIARRPRYYADRVDAVVLELDLATGGADG